MTKTNMSRLFTASGAAIALAAVVLTACGNSSGAAAAGKIIVIGAGAAFEEKWNPFLSESYYDNMVMDQIFTPICQYNDRNELVPYGGTISAEDNGDGTVRYTVTVNKGMKFTNGQNVTIDDYIWAWHVLADPSYTGPSTPLTTHIEGIEAYYYDDPNYSSRLAALEQDAVRYTSDAISLPDFLIYSRATNLDGWWNGDPAGDTGGGETWSQYAEEEGFGDKLKAIDASDPGAMLDLIAEIEWTNYRNSYDTYNWFLGQTKKDYALGNLSGGVNVASITGIQKIDEYTCMVLMTEIDIYGDRNLNLSLIPRSYYGEITKGDVSAILSNMKPVGSGPYIWQDFSDNIVTCLANQNFFKGVPKVGAVRWQYIPDTETLSALASGQIDIAEPNATQQAIAEMDELGLAYHLVDNAGYGYMGMNVQRLPLNVRKGYWSLMNRGPSVEGWYGPDLAQVIERPMTTTLAEYPVNAQPYYTYSRDEALKFFQLAGYSQVNGQLVDKDGKQLVINTYIGGFGEGSHPAYAMLVQAAEDMRALGGEIQIQDVAFNVLQGAMNDGTADSWIMAWATIRSCDKSGQFHSQGGQNRSRFSDARMDQLLENILKTIDLEERRALVAEMLDLAMEQCIEFPLYQRKNCIAYNPQSLDMNTVPVASTSADYRNALWSLDVKTK
ncbi:MAG: ABC transporter substrate-binding protein [Treponema sp.]|jgi:peptide/nickel transport system substrate-binding protein|nr:ABC transporter substrate-binding protein [Treponema sp.]